MTAVEYQRLWLPIRFPSENDVIASAKGAAGTGAAYSKAKRELTEAVFWHAKSAKPRLKPMAGPVRLSFLWVETDRRRDPDNIAAGGRKAILDGLVMAKILAGDGWDHVESWTDAFAVGDKAGVHVALYAGAARPG